MVAKNYKSKLTKKKTKEKMTKNNIIAVDKNMNFGYLFSFLRLTINEFIFLALKGFFISLLNL